MIEHQPLHSDVGSGSNDLTVTVFNLIEKSNPATAATKSPKETPGRRERSLHEKICHTPIRQHVKLN
jgi:hypothetical protein